MPRGLLLATVSSVHEKDLARTSIGKYQWVNTADVLEWVNACCTPVFLLVIKFVLEFAWHSCSSFLLSAQFMACSV